MAQDGKVYTPDLSLIYTLQNANDNPQVVENAYMEEHLEKSLHPITEELKRWQSIIGEYYIDYKLEEQRNSLAYKP